MPQNPELLTVRAAFPGRTYVGTHFCPGEENVRGIYENLSADKQLAVNSLRANAQTATDLNNVVADMSGLRVTQRIPLINCLTTIFEGDCTVYPRQ